MIAVTEMGGIVFPPLPAFYHRPQTIEDLVDDTVERVLALLGVESPHPSPGADSRTRLRPLGTPTPCVRRRRHSGIQGGLGCRCSDPGPERDPALEVQVVAEDHAPEPQVGLRVEQTTGVAIADQSRPERHHLREAARPGNADRVLSKAAFDLDRGPASATALGRPGALRTKVSRETRLA
jgi:hypothetical protein